MIKKILEKYSVQYCAVMDGEVSHIIIMLPYLPYKSYPDNCANIDAFYHSSNKLYHICKDIISDFKLSNIEVVNTGYLNLKKLAEQGGLGTILNNQLVATRDHGSKITLQDITIRATFEHNPKLKVAACDASCRGCDNACPTGALCAGAFDRAKCLRHMQDNPDSVVLKMSKRVLGCEECQRACPHNSKVDACDMPAEVAAVLDIDSLICSIAQGKKSMSDFANIFGYNYSRPSWIAKLVIYSLMSASDYSHSESVSKLLNHQNQQLIVLAKSYLTKCDSN